MRQPFKSLALWGTAASGRKGVEHRLLQCRRGLAALAARRVAGLAWLVGLSSHPGAAWPNPSIERTFQRPLRALWPAAHVKR